MTVARQRARAAIRDPIADPLSPTLLVVVNGDVEGAGIGSGGLVGADVEVAADVEGTGTDGAGGAERGGEGVDAHGVAPARERDGRTRQRDGVGLAGLAGDGEGGGGHAGAVAERRAATARTGARRGDGDHARRRAGHDVAEVEVGGLGDGDGGDDFDARGGARGRTVLRGGEGGRGGTQGAQDGGCGQEGFDGEVRHGGHPFARWRTESPSGQRFWRLGTIQLYLIHRYEHTQGTAPLR
jgi:hypothetical protein